MRRNAGRGTRTLREGGVFLGFALVLIALAFGSHAVMAASGDAAADRVLGQSTFEHNQPNQGSSATDSSLWYPAGVAVDKPSGRIFVSDRRNARVQSWPHAATFSNGAAADFSIMWDGSGLLKLDPVSTATDSTGNLYIADLINNRVLVYPPFTTTVAFVIGQVLSTTNSNNQGLSAPTASTLSGPFSVATDASGHLFVADQTNNRVLRYTLPITTNNQPADLVLGQGNFVSGAANRGGTPDRNTLFLPQGVEVDQAGSVYVADTWNHRLLKFVAPLSNGMDASLVLGQADYVSGVANRGGAYPTAQTLNNPVGIAVDDRGRIYVADCNNHRVLGYSPIGMVDGAAAQFIFGQPDFGSAQYNPSAPPTASALAFPKGVAVDSAMNVYVADNFNHRALGYDLPWIMADLHLPLIIK